MAVVWRRTAGEAEGLPGRPWGVRCPAAVALLPDSAARVLDLTGDQGIPEGPGRVEAVVAGDPESDEFAPELGGFDAVACGRLLEQVRDPERLLRRAGQWLRPGGCVLARLGNARHRKVLAGLLGGSSGGDGAEADRVRFFTRREVEKLFYRAGFALEALRGVPDADAPRPDGPAAAADVDLGPLLVRGVPPGAAQEFFSPEYLARAAFRPAPDPGLTSIVILTHNQLAYTRLCLDGIRLHTDEPYEVIVVDNASTDGTPEYLRSIEGVTLIRNATNRGFPAAANQGIRAAKGRQVLLLNNDAVPTTGWLRRMLDALHGDPAAGLVGPCSNRVSGEQQVEVGYDEDLVGLEASRGSGARPTTAAGRRRTGWSASAC